MSPLPLGKEEDDTLEFKAADALKTPAQIARGLVAMLNNEGGELWVGIGEKNGFAVELQPIASPESAKNNLWNHILDTLDPAPTVDEIQMQLVDADGGRVIRIKVAVRPHRKPFAYRKGQDPVFPIRAGARIRAMTRVELGQAFRNSEIDQSHHDPDGQRRLDEARARVLQCKEPSLWIRIQPEGKRELKLASRKLGELMTDPKLSGNRTTGWAFANPMLYRPDVQTGRMVFGRSADHGATAMERLGAIEHTVALQRLTHPLERLRQSTSSSKTLYPLALVERTVSIFRLAKSIFADSNVWEGSAPSNQTSCLVGCVIINADKWRLLGHSMGLGWLPEAFELGRDFEHLAGRLEADFFLDPALTILAGDLIANPDPCARRLLERIYEAFKLSGDKLPPVFNPETRQLVIPE